jgi:hypothetical protein
MPAILLTAGGRECVQVAQFADLKVLEERWVGDREVGWARIWCHLRESMARGWSCDGQLGERQARRQWDADCWDLAVVEDEVLE